MIAVADISNLNELLEAVNRLAIRTSQGSFIRVDDLNELLRDRNAQRVVEKLKPKPRTFKEARVLAHEDPKLADPTPVGHPTGEGGIWAVRPDGGRKTQEAS